MEKTCEFCKAISPIVYCKSDAAHLCLSCDAKVHSANALSYRHPRTLVCDSCRFQPANVRCFVHEMFMCKGCETSHCFSSQHERKVVSCYFGCPSAKELAVLWGFNLDENHSRTKAVKDDHNGQQRSYLILQQILDLERLQLCEGIDNACLVHVKEPTNGSPFKLHTHIEFQKMGSPCTEQRIDEALSSPFSQIDHLSNTGNPVQGDSFWQYKNPMHNNEIWLQNIQDLGVCDEVQYTDDVNIPDVDLTFRNFEELFGNEHEPTRADEENIPSFGTLERGCGTTIEHSNDVGHEIDSSNEAHQFDTFNYHPRPIRPCYSSSFSESRLTSKNNGSHNAKLDVKENVIMRYKEKKVLRHEKQGQYKLPKSKTDGKW